MCLTKLAVAATRIIFRVSGASGPVALLSFLVSHPVVCFRLGFCLWSGAPWFLSQLKESVSLLCLQKNQ